MSSTERDSALDVNRHALLKEGARSYLEALTALTIFRKDVQSVCRQAIESRLPEFSQALGVSSLKAESIVPYATPEDQFNGTSAYLGVQHKISRRRHSIQRLTCISYCGLSWESGGKTSGFGCSVSVWFNRREVADSLSAGFRQNEGGMPSGIELNAKSMFAIDAGRIIRA